MTSCFPLTSSLASYHHVDIAKEHWKYLGFSWQSLFYVFTVLPFGLSSACYIFTKLVRPLVKYWRERGLRIIVYLDDGLCAMSGEANVLEASALVQSTLSQAGFVAHATKSIWKPTQRLQWLGFVVDLSDGQIEVPEDRIAALRVKLQTISQSKLVSASKCCRQCNIHEFGHWAGGPFHDPQYVLTA